MNRRRFPPVYVLTCTAALTDGPCAGLFDPLDGGDVLHWARDEARAELDDRTSECSCRGAGKHGIVAYRPVARRKARRS